MLYRNRIIDRELMPLLRLLVSRDYQYLLWDWRESAWKEKRSRYRAIHGYFSWLAITGGVVSNINIIHVP